ncbi:hypothetical protein Tco_0129116 [Tanacetum coccineum]
MVSPLNDNKIDFRISFDESDDEDYMPEGSYSNDLDFFKDFENEFPAIVYNDALTSKSDFLTKPTVSPQHIDELNLKNETSLSECDKKEQNILYFNDLFHFNVIYPDDLKSDKDNDIDEIDIEPSSGDMYVVPLPNVINTDDCAYAQSVKTSQENAFDQFPIRPVKLHDQFDDEKRAGAELTQQNDKSQYKKLKLILIEKITSEVNDAAEINDD